MRMIPDSVPAGKKGRRAAEARTTRNLAPFIPRAVIMEARTMTKLIPESQRP